MGNYYKVVRLQLEQEEYQQYGRCHIPQSNTWNTLGICYMVDIIQFDKQKPMGSYNMVEKYQIL
jgi:hypothetical protein